MNIIKRFKPELMVCLGVATMFFASCKKDGNPNNLPDVSPADYEGKIDGFNNSEEIFPNNLVAYWSFDGTKNELKSGTAPTTTLNDALVAGGVRGQALSLNGGFLYYATQFQKFKTDTLKNWSLSIWAKIKNNGSKRTMVFQNARPGIFNGNINVALNTNGFPSTNDSVLRLQPTFASVNSGNGTTAIQDNLNSVIDKFNLNDWVHIVLTYDISTGTFNNWINAVKVGNFPNRGTTNIYKSWEPNEVIIGSNYNGIPGKAVSTDVSFAPMTGQLDEIRMFNIALPDAYIRALYNLGKAGK